jgi:hypothetical protein
VCITVCLSPGFLRCTGSGRSWISAYHVLEDLIDEELPEFAYVLFVSHPESLYDLADYSQARYRPDDEFLKSSNPGSSVWHEYHPG